MSTIEALLEKEHGDLHEVIPRLATELGQEKAAQRLEVKQSWLSLWLRTNGYVRVTQYVKESELEKAS